MLWVFDIHAYYSEEARILSSKYIRRYTALSCLVESAHAAFGDSTFCDIEDILGRNVRYILRQKRNPMVFFAP